MNSKLVVLAFAATAVAPVNAAIITQWNFNSNPPDSSLSTGTTTPSIGTGTASTVGGVTATFASGNANGGSTDPITTDNSGWQTTNYAAQGTGDKTRGVQFNVSTVGFQDIIVSWDQRHSNTAARHVQFQYSLDGVNFIDFGAPFAGTSGDTWFNNRSVDLSSITGVNDITDFAFRLVATFAPSTTAYAPSNNSSTYAATGTWRFDMVTVSGTAILAPPPAGVSEPGTIALMLAGMGLVGMAARRRRA